MGNFLFTLAIVLLVLWVIGFLGYGIGGLIHALLVIAILSFLLRIIQGNKYKS